MRRRTRSLPFRRARENPDLLRALLLPQERPGEKHTSPHRRDATRSLSLHPLFLVPPDRLLVRWGHAHPESTSDKEESAVQTSLGWLAWHVGFFGALPSHQQE